MSDSQINSLGFVADVEDQGSGAAKSVADALKNLGQQADAASAGLDAVDQSGTSTTSTVSTKLLPSMTQLNRVLDDNAAMNAKVAAVEAQRTRYLDALAASTSAATDAGLSYEAAQAKINDRFDAQIEKITSIKTAQQDMAAAVATSASAMDKASASVKEATTVSGEASFALRQLGVQAVQGFSGIATGQPILTTLIQQGHQVVDVALSTGVGIRGMGAAALEMVGGVTGLTVALGAGAALGLAGALVAVGVHAEDEASALAKLSVQLRATRTDAADMAAEINAASKVQVEGVSRADVAASSRTIGTTFDFSGTQAQLTDLVALSRDLAAEWSETVPEAAKTVSQALADPGAVADTLAKQHFPGMTQALAESIARLQSAGESGKATAEVLSVLEANARGAYQDGLTPFQSALQRLHDAFAPPVQDGKDLAKSLGTDMVDAATAGVNALDAYIERLKFLYANKNASASDLAMSAIGLTQGPIKTGSTAGLTTNPTSGALGLMQIMPGMQTSFANQGIDITTEAGNIQAGLQVLSDGLSKYGGNITQALGYYGGFSDVNSAGAKAYAASVMGQDESNLSSSTARDIYDHAQSAGMGQYSTLAQRIALQESGGRQFANPLSSPMNTDLSGAVVSPNYNGLVNQTATLSDAASKAGGTSWSDQAAQIQANIKALTDYRATLDPTSVEYQTLTERIDTQTGALRNAKSGQALLTQSLEDSLAPLQAASGYQRTMAEVMKDFTLKAKEQSGGVVDLGAEHAALAAKQVQLATAFSDGTKAITDQTASQSGLIAAYGQGAAAVQHVTDQSQAMLAADQDFQKGSPAYLAGVKARTQALDDQAAVQARAQVASQIANDKDQLTYIQAETSSLGENAQARAVMLAQMQAELAMHQKFGDVLPPEAQQYIALQGQIAAATVNYQQQQQALSDLANGVSNVFSTLGDDISQAFTQGSGSAVNFKSILAGLETQIASLAVKFAVINPLMNSLFGQNNTTLGTISSALSGSTSLSGAGSGITSLLGSAGTSLSSGGSNILSGIGNLFSGATTSTSTFTVTPGLGTSALSAAAPAAGLWNGGSALGGFGSLGGALGIGGSVLPGLLSGNYAQAALGGAGAAIGTAILPGVGTALGGLAGNLLGGLFGGHKKNPYTLDTVSTAGGQLSIGSSYNQAEDDKYTAQLASDISSLNATFKSLGLTVSAGNGNAQGSLGIVGDGAGNAAGSIASYLNAIRFGGASGSFAGALSTDSFSADDYGSVSAFQTAIASLKTMADTVDTLRVRVTAFNADASAVTVGGAGSFSGYSSATAAALDTALDGKTLSTSDLTTQIGSIVTFVEQTMPQLLQATTQQQSSYQQSVAGLDSTYGSAITQAQALGLSTTALSNKLASLKGDMLAAANVTLGYQTGALQVRDLKATGQDEAADLLNQHLSAEQERTAFDQSWQAIYGDAYTQASGYGAALATLTKTQADERLQIEQEYADKATQAAQSAADASTQAAQQMASAQQGVVTTISNLSSYATSLATSSTSPLSVQDQYEAAKANEQAVAAQALQGDPTALSQLQSAISTMLSLSQTFNAGGAGFVTDFNKAESDLAGVGNLSAETLTQTFYAQQNQDLQATITDGLTAIRTEIVKLQSITRTAALAGAGA